MQTLGVAPLNASENRAHFGAWAITSAPLVLGLDLTNKSAVDAVWPIIANPEALAVNTDWAGESGTRFFASSDVVRGQDRRQRVAAARISGPTLLTTRRHPLRSPARPLAPHDVPPRPPADHVYAVRLVGKKLLLPYDPVLEQGTLRR